RQTFVDSSLVLSAGQYRENPDHLVSGISGLWLRGRGEYLGRVRHRRSLPERNFLQEPAESEGHRRDRYSHQEDGVQRRREGVDVAVVNRGWEMGQGGGARSRFGVEPGWNADASQ